MSPLIEVSDLQQITSPNLVIVDASGPANAKYQFEDKHIPGAIFVDLNADLSEINDPSKGGRHPLPSSEKFGRTLSQLGITPNSHVVIYDHLGGGNAAARMWWMLKAQGHQKVQVLNGGFQVWENAGLTLISGQSKPRSTYNTYPTTDWQLAVIDLEDVIQVSKNKSQTIVDVREGYRYNGESEPIDMKAGHIPNATNIFFKDNLGEDGTFKSPDELKLMYKSITQKLENNEVIVHCGSGVTACHSILALAHAGLPLPKLYVGSWSEWSRNDLPVETNN
ncbi:MAG TPA: sulfurtransferase [Cytophagales bacterium]|nr:sulfurtransferase [Cytophagales bacterium]